MVILMHRITSYKFINNNKNKNILFLHGWGCDYTYFTNIASKIDNANCLLIDLLNFGKNEIIEKPLTFNDYIDSIVAFLKEKQIKINIIIGHSFGGKLAIYLTKYIDVSSLILFAPSIYNKRRGLKYYSKILFYKIIKRIKKFKKYLNKFGSDDYKYLSGFMKKTMSNIINFSVDEQVKKYNNPIILIFGINDKTTPIYLAKKIKRRAKDAYLFKIDGDHFAFLNNNLFSLNVIKEMVEKI